MRTFFAPRGAARAAANASCTLSNTSGSLTYTNARVRVFLRGGGRGKRAHERESARERESSRALACARKNAKAKEGKKAGRER